MLSPWRHCAGEGAESGGPAGVLLDDRGGRLGRGAGVGGKRTGDVLVPLDAKTVICEETRETEERKAAVVTHAQAA